MTLGGHEDRYHGSLHVRLHTCNAHVLNNRRSSKHSVNREHTRESTMRRHGFLNRFRSTRQRPSIVRFNFDSFHESSFSHRFRC